MFICEQTLCMVFLMEIINFGSMNTDYVYSVDHIVATGETIAAQCLQNFPGGKGLNQSVALARAGARVRHACFYGADGESLAEHLAAQGVDVSLLEKTDAPQGHAIIQVDSAGGNSIIVFEGSNGQMTTEYIDAVLRAAGETSCVLVQNETSNPEHVISRASELGLCVFFNPSPIKENLQKIDLAKVDWLLINETEGSALTGQTDPQRILARLLERFPSTDVVLTLGGDGLVCRTGGRIYTQAAYKVKAVDTTAAGDTFTGYFAAGIMRGVPVEEILKTASKAAALCVSCAGASPSIPTRAQVAAFDA